MKHTFQFQLVYALPRGPHDPYELSDAIFEAGYEDAIIGTGNPNQLAIELEVQGFKVNESILEAHDRIISKLPEGASLREILPVEVYRPKIEHDL